MIWHKVLCNFCKVSHGCCLAISPTAQQHAVEVCNGGFSRHHETSPKAKSFPPFVADSPKGGGGESSSLDEDSSDALSPDQPANHDSPLSAVPQLSPSDALSQNGDVSPSQVLVVQHVVSQVPWSQTSQSVVWLDVMTLLT